MLSSISKKVLKVLKVQTKRFEMENSSHKKNKKKKKNFKIIKNKIYNHFPILIIKKKKKKKTMLHVLAPNGDDIYESPIYHLSRSFSFHFRRKPKETCFGKND